MKFRVKSTVAAVLACAAGTACARWIEDGVGAAWGATPAETAAAYVPWDDAERTRATVGTLALAATVADSNTVVVAGAGVEAANGTYTLMYEDEEYMSYMHGSGEYEVYATKAGYAELAYIVEWASLYECNGWPGGAWTTVEGVGTDPAPSAGYATGDATNEVAYARTLRWDLAHGWGNHAEAGYLAAEADPYAVRLDQSTPQGMDGFPLWENPEQRIEGKAVAGSTSHQRAIGALPGLASFTNGTFSTWVKNTTTAGTYCKFIVMCNDNSLFTLTQEPDDKPEFRLILSIGGSVAAKSPAPLMDGLWTHLVATWNGTNGNLLLYTNGALCVSNAYTGTPGWAACSTLYFYHSNPGYTARRFNGTVDDTALWGRTLAASEVADLHRNRMACDAGTVFPSTGTGTMAALLRCYKFEETAGTTSVDSSPYAENLTWTSTPSWGREGVVRSVVGIAYNEYLRVAADLGRPADVGRGVFQVGNAEATTRLLGALAVGALHAAPASASAPGLPGDVRIAANALYVCVATNAWVKAAMASW